MEINKKILLIDDQEEILNSLKKLLAGEDNLSNINNKMKDLVNDFFILNTLFFYILQLVVACFQPASIHAR